MADTNKPIGAIKDKAKEATATVGRAAHEAKETVKDTASNLADKARDAASNLGDKARETASNLGDRAQDLAAGATERAGEGIASLGQGMSSLAGTLRERAPNEGMLGSAAAAVADRLDAGGHYLQEHGLEDMGEDLRELIRKYPLGSALAVFGAGFLLGNALRR